MTGASGQLEDFRANVLGHHCAEESVRVGVENGDGHDLSGLAQIALKDHDPIAVCSSSHLDGARGQFDRVFLPGCAFAGSFDEDLDALSDELQIVFFADSVLNFQQPVIALPFDIVGHVIGQLIGGPGSRSLAVFENKAVLEAAFFDKLYGLLKIVFGFAAESDDKVAGNGMAGDLFSDARHHFAILCDGIATFHGLEHAIRAALQRDVEIGRAFGQRADGGEQVVAHVLGIIGHEFQTLDAVDFVNLVE